MANTSDGRRKVRIDALIEVITAIREVRCPPGKPQGWATEFNHAVEAAIGILENQLAQAEGRVMPRRRKGR